MMIFNRKQEQAIARVCCCPLKNTLLVSDKASRNDITEISLEIKNHGMCDLNSGLNNHMDGST